ncbi:unnamed protein product [Polarella glacialis]|uniref:EF-hand domain-containing protein n=1 Tax=Polarella glacialis TaxID=89957 RepID=A0A813J4R6_POLGL|nr:unnamed protein product [Polarella glacialis]
MAGAFSSEAHELALRLCRDWDTDGDGFVSIAELEGALTQVCPGVPRRDLQVLSRSVDVNGDGIIHYAEVLRWLRMPPTSSGTKLAFEDIIRSSLLPGAPTAGRGAGPAQPRHMGAIHPEDTVRSGPAQGEDLASGFAETSVQMDAFTHPLLRCCSVAQDPLPSSAGAVVMRLLPPGKQLEGGAELRSGSDGAVEIAVPHLEYAQATGLSGHLVALAKAYRLLLICFLSSEHADKCLRLVPLQTLPLEATVLWSSVALALACLSPAHQRLLSSDGKLDFHCGATGDKADSMRAALTAKVLSAAVGLEIPGDNQGRLSQKKDGYSWVRRDRSPEARFSRLEAFMLTQRAVYSEGFSFPAAAPEEVRFRSVLRMVKETKVFHAPSLDAPACVGEVSSSSPPQLELMTAEHVKPPVQGSTVIEVASAFAALSVRVVAVNAASAYQVGGGASVGGRHALEEAWCLTSSLFQSLNSVESMQCSGVSTPFSQHVPTLGCIVSPSVEIFRESSDAGYGFLKAPTELTGVVSVAMFNRNPGVADSPLDSPEDPAEYLSQTRSKLEAAVLAAVEVLDAQVLVLTDLGCGIFMNDPYIVGGCLGSVLRRHRAKLKNLQKVVLAGASEAFASSCSRAWRGEDPRPSCLEGALCSRCISDPAHASRYSHAGAVVEEGGAGDSVVDAALLMLANYPADPNQSSLPPCRYGSQCRITKAEHLLRFLHPEQLPGGSGGSLNPRPASSARGITTTTTTRGIVSAEKPGDRPSTAGAKTPGSENFLRAPQGARSTPTITAKGQQQQQQQQVRRQASPLPKGTQLSSSSGSRCNPDQTPVCKYGEACYSQNPNHLAEFSHPWRQPGGESEQQAEERRETQQSHLVLNLAKAEDWEKVRKTLLQQPQLVDLRPANRTCALIHYAAFQLSTSTLDMLLTDFGADPLLQTKDGQTPLEMIKTALKTEVNMSATDRRRAENAMLRLGRSTGAKISDPSSAFAGMTAASGPSATPGSSSPATEAAAKASRTVLTVTASWLNCEACIVDDLNGDYGMMSGFQNGKPTYEKAGSSQYNIPLTNNGDGTMFCCCFAVVPFIFPFLFAFCLLLVG